MTGEQLSQLGKEREEGEELNQLGKERKENE